MAWPPTLADVKSDAKITDTRDDVALQRMLDAAVAFYERVKRGVYNFTGDSGDDNPAPGPDQELGIIRLTLRWKARQNSPEALITAGELGSARVPSFDPDIDRMLRLGRFAPARFA